MSNIFNANKTRVNNVTLALTFIYKYIMIFHYLFSGLKNIGKMNEVRAWVDVILKKII